MINSFHRSDKYQGTKKNTFHLEGFEPTTSGRDQRHSNRLSSEARLEAGHGNLSVKQHANGYVCEHSNGRGHDHSHGYDRGHCH